MLKLEDYIVDWPDIDYPNFIAWMRHGREQWPNRVAIRYRAGKSKQFTEWSYERLFSEAEAFARVLLAAGCVNDDRVALWSENRPEWCAVWLGAVIAGCAAGSATCFYGDSVTLTCGSIAKIRNIDYLRTSLPMLVPPIIVTIIFYLIAGFIF